MINKKEKHHVFHFIVLAVFILLAYINAFTMEFVWDDISQIRDNTYLDSDHLKDFFLKDTGTVMSNGEESTPYYRPLFVVSLFIDKLIWNKNPFGFHFTNILMHLEITILIYLLLLKLFKNTKTAMAASALFAIHPVHSEVVAYISARTHLVCSLFFVLAFYLYILWRREKKNYAGWFSIFSFIASLLSNEMAVTFPAVILFYEICFEQKNLKSILYPVLFFVLACLFVLGRFLILKNSSWTDIPLEYRVLTGVQVVEKYLKLLILPVGLKPFYEIPLAKNPFSVTFIISALLMLFHIVMAILFWKKKKSLLFGLCWIFFTLLPVSNIPAALYPSLLAERYLYLPSIGFAIIFGISVSIMVEFLKNRLTHDVFLTVRKVSFVAGVLFTICFIALCLLRNAPYKNDTFLWENAVKKEPESVYSHFRLALAYEEEGNLEKAKNELETVLEKSPQKVVQERLFYLYKRLGFSDAEARLKIGLVLVKEGLYNSAAVYLLKATKEDDNLAEAHNALGIVFEEKGLHNKAVEEFKKAVKLNPFKEGYRQNLLRALSNS